MINSLKMPSEESFNGKKGKNGGVINLAGGTLFVIYLNTFIVWLWPDASVWALGVVVVLGVIFVTYVYRTTRNAEPEDGEK